jgi:cbb3-type cytochrome oxidase maturation protein
MNVIMILVIASVGFAVLFLGGFIWAVRSGQFDDTTTPSIRVLTEAADDSISLETNKEPKQDP